jgi:hypothetical protein
MSYDNLMILLMVIVVVVCVLGFVGAGIYCLNKAVDQNDH